METQECLDQLRDVAADLEKCFKREKEITEEWKNTSDVQKQNKLEKESRDLPIEKLLKKRLKLLKTCKCFYTQ